MSQFESMSESEKHLAERAYANYKRAELAEDRLRMIERTARQLVYEINEVWRYGQEDEILA